MTFLVSPGVCVNDTCMGCDQCDKDGKKRCKHEWLYGEERLIPIRQCLRCSTKEKFVVVSYWERV